MGYITYFNLRMFGPDEKVRKAEDDIKALSPDGWLDELADYGYSELKWYDWERDINKVAKANPDVLIILDGDGEESDDLWQYRVKGAVSEYHAFVLPPFTKPELLLNEEKTNQ